MAEKRILAVDIGNTNVKLSVFAGDRCIRHRYADADTDALETVRGLLEDTGVCGAVLCCAGRDTHRLSEWLPSAAGFKTVVLSADTPLPVAIAGYCRRSLGTDRIAAAAGGAVKGENVLVVDAGTALTCDLVSDARFEGGVISPGLSLRFKALSEHTSRLPLIDAHGDTPLLGCDTETAIRSGVLGGMAGEVERIAMNLKTTYKELKIVLTGGDAGVVAPMLCGDGFDVQVDPDCVARGLVRIFNHND